MKQGFTLAEVLITIGIIGVVAAIIMPNVLVQTRERQFISQLKKVHTTLSQVYQTTLIEYGEPNQWGLVAQNDSEGANKLNDRIIPFFRVLKNCKTDGGCWPNVELKYLDNSSSGINISNNPAYSTASIEGGTLIAFRVIDPTCNYSMGNGIEYGRVCAEVVVDINGEKNPNAYGYDIHTFYITGHGYIPAGYPDDTVTSFANNCANGNRGTGCAAWIINWSNMDYLHCSDLSWSGKNKCSKIFNYNYSLL